jgi:hypothetical protein
LGYGTGRTLDRVVAAMGQLDGAPLEFERADELANAGVLCALPALLANGLLRHSRRLFELPAGYYPLEAIFLVLAFLALVGIRSLEALRYEGAGEWGRLVGLDRIPEVKTLRKKIGLLCSPAGRAQRWSGLLGQEWMQTYPESVGIFYVDGHVRVYHGKQTSLPRRYVARERLCLRGTTDYWVNAMDGQPFFVVTQAADPGLVKVLEAQIVPRLLVEAPAQPSEQALAQDRWANRFTLVFDREGYSPHAFARWKQQRIAVITYRKFVRELWAEEEFFPQEVQLVHGEELSMELAERGVRLSNGLWVRELRRRLPCGHQTAILTTDYRSDMRQIAPKMFARWCQENFFKYMQEHYNLDRLVEYGTEPLPETTRIINPAWRQLDGQVRRQASALGRQQAKFAGLSLSVQPQAKELEVFKRRQGELQQEIAHRQRELEQLKAQRKQTTKHILIKDLPPSDRFTRLKEDKKHFVDTIKLIAYRAETALVSVVREKMHRLDDARSLVRQILTNSADLLPDHKNKTLTVRLHHLTAAVHDEVLVHLCDQLNQTQTIYPGTDLRLEFQILGSS